MFWEDQIVKGEFDKGKEKTKKKEKRISWLQVLD
jgi:hypothetical protein